MIFSLISHSLSNSPILSANPVALGPEVLSTTVPVALEQFIATHETLMIGCATYVSGLLLLNILEQSVKKLDLGSTLPRRKLGSCGFNKEQREFRFTTPVSINSNRIYPTLQQLESPYLVEVNLKLELFQYITTNSSYNIYIDGIQERSMQWSEMFHTDVFIFKKKNFLPSA